jgi:hypothetical protein
MGDIVSRHLFRRTARTRADRLNATAYIGSPYRYVVTKATRGPWRWYVRREVIA